MWYNEPTLRYGRLLFVDDPIGRWLLEALLLALSALMGLMLSAIENANENKIEEAAQEDHRLRPLLKLLDSPKPTIAALQGLRVLFLMLFAALLTVMCQSEGIHPAVTALLCCLASAPVGLVLCMMVPEKLGRLHADRAVQKLYPMMRAITALMKPITALEHLLARGLLRLCGVDPKAREEEVTQEEIRAMVDIGEESGVIESNEHEMIKNVFDFGNLTAADCMTHRTDVTALWIGDDEETILKTIRESGLSRFPVYNEDIDDVVGVLATRDYLLNLELPQPQPLKALLRAPYFVPETVPSDVLLQNMQRAKKHLAIVVDEYGGMSGLITMEDLLEEIVGNIYDEFDAPDEAEIEKVGENQWRVSGTADLEALGEEMNVTLPTGDDYDTLGGLVFSRFPTIPQDGSTPSLMLYCTEDGEKPEDGDAPRLEIQVEKIAERRIEKALLTLLLPEKTEEDE